MERTFGVEIELIGTTKRQVLNAVSALGIQICEENYNHITRRHWKVVDDASVSGLGGFEVVSPVLSGAAGLEEVRKVADAIASVGGTAVSKCGLHVHIGATRGHLTADNVRKIVERYAAHEAEIDAVMPISRRANNNRIYCASIRGNVASRIVNTTCTDVTDLPYYQPGRMYKVNLQAINRHGTVEFRHHSGSTESAKIVNWIQFLIAFVNRSVELTGTAIVTRSVSNGSPRPGTKRAAVLEGIRNGASVEAIAARTGKSVENILWTINCIARDYGYRFVRRSSFGATYFSIASETRTTVAREDVNDRSAFDGCSPEVKRFYKERAAYFARRENREVAA